MKVSKLELALARQLVFLRVPPWQTEYRFAPPRLWRFDFAWPDIRLAIEVEGGIWTNGAHTRGRHFNSDCEKYNSAALRGWVVLRYTETQINNRSAAITIAAAVEQLRGEGRSLGRSLPQADETVPSPAHERRARP